VVAVINSVSLRHTGSGQECGLLTGPMEVDIAELSAQILLLGVSECEARSYNRIRVVFDENVTLTENSLTQICRFVSYKDDSGNPNILACDPLEDTCTLEINGAVNVFAGQHEEVALDFELKDFEVEGFPGVDCTVTMKVSPLHASGMEGKKQQGYMESVVGSVTSHDAGSKTFTLSHGNATYTVDYSGLQGGSETFTLLFNGTESIAVDYSQATVGGALADGAIVEVKLSGVGVAAYTASKVEVQ
jgi:hypothetical protein